VKAAYVPPSQRIRSERSSKCGVCECGCGPRNMSVCVGPSFNERLPTYLYQKGSGPNVVRNVENVLWV
jgi:hypothetical protein